MARIITKLDWIYTWLNDPDLIYAFKKLLCSPDLKTQDEREAYISKVYDRLREYELS